MFTPAPGPNDLDAAMAAALVELQAEYVASMPERLNELRAALAAANEDPSARVTVRRAGHRIAGTAATVGLSIVGEVGRSIEHFAERCAWTPNDLSMLSRATDLIAELVHVSASGAALPTVLDDDRYAALGGRA